MPGDRVTPLPPVAARPSASASDALWSRGGRPPRPRGGRWCVIPEDAAFTKLKHTKRSSERLIQDFQSVLDSALSLSDSKLISNVGGNSDQANHCDTGHDFML